MFEYRVRVRPSSRGQGDLPGLFDMMRYDQCTVVTWDHVSEVRAPIGEHYVLTLRSPREPVVDRWNSFNLVVTDIREV
jgi:hypothetical protein